MVKRDDCGVCGVGSWKTENTKRKKTTARVQKETSVVSGQCRDRSTDRPVSFLYLLRRLARDCCRLLVLETSMHRGIFIPLLDYTVL